MRENLFKAKKWDNGEWIEGYFVKIKDVTEHNLILTGELSKGAYTDFIGYEVDPETLCRFSRLTDKNSKEIWENDILMCHGNPEELVKAVFGEFGVRNIETGTVVDKAIGWHYEVIPTDEISRCEPFCYSMPLTEEYIKRCEMEVVDNPELLQEIKR